MSPSPARADTRVDTRAGTSLVNHFFAAGVLLELARPGTVGFGGCALLALIAAVLFWLFIFPGVVTARGTPARPSVLQRPGGVALITGAALLVACAWWLAASAVVWVGGRCRQMGSGAGLTAFGGAPLCARILSSGERALMALLIAILVFWRHEANIRRLLAGTEPRIGKTAK